jgi:hypothetical protein
MNTRPLTEGEMIQYRKVGKARLVKYYPEKSGRSTIEDECRDRREGWWNLEFITGPRKYKEDKDGIYWISVRDRIES